MPPADIVVGKSLAEIFEQDNKIFEVEEKNRVYNRSKSSLFIGPVNKNYYSSKDNGHDDDEDGGAYSNMPSSGQSDGPRSVF